MHVSSVAGVYVFGVCFLSYLCPPKKIADGLEDGLQSGLHDGWIVHGKVNWITVRGKVKLPKIVCATFNGGGHVSCHLWLIASHFDNYDEPTMSGYKLHHQGGMVGRELQEFIVLMHFLYTVHERVLLSLFDQSQQSSGSGLALVLVWTFLRPGLLFHRHESRRRVTSFSHCVCPSIARNNYGGKCRLFTPVAPGFAWPSIQTRLVLGPLSLRFSVLSENRLFILPRTSQNKLVLWAVLVRPWSW